MYLIEPNEGQAKMLENELTNDAFYVGIGISQIFGAEEGIICGIIDKEGIEGFLEGDYLETFKKTKVKRAIENLLCCGILILENGKLKFDRDRYCFINHLGNQLEEEKHKNYKGIGTYEDVLDYEKMIKYVNKLID